VLRVAATLRMAVLGLVHPTRAVPPPSPLIVPHLLGGVVSLSSLVKVWNYRKTPERGAAEVHMLLDDLMIFSGCLRRSAGGPHDEADEAQSVLFTNDPKVGGCRSDPSGGHPRGAFCQRQLPAEARRPCSSARAETRVRAVHADGCSTRTSQ
jgi:hypothetical protein